MTANTHVLKTHPHLFAAMKRGAKNFDVRKDDRAFQTGDILVIKYFDPDDESTKHPRPPMPEDKEREPMSFRITFVLRGGQFGIEAGYVVLGLVRTTEAFTANNP